MEKYLTKPISKGKIISVVEEATAKVDKVRDQRSNLLKIQEKLETVIPVVESSYVSALLSRKGLQAADYYHGFWILHIHRVLLWWCSLGQAMKTAG